MEQADYEGSLAMLRRIARALNWRLEFAGGADSGAAAEDREGELGIQEAYNQGMATQTEILMQALTLPPEARAALADSLLDSLDTDVDEDAAEQWRVEIRKRMAELDAGTVETVAWDDVRVRLGSVLK